MDFALTEEDLLIQATAAQFAEEKIKPFAAEWDKTAFFPKDLFKEAAALGFAGLITRAEVGGSGLSRLQAALVFEQLARACVSTSAYLSIHNMVTRLIDQHGNDFLRHQFCPKLCTMDLFSSYCLTEPDSGSDAASLKTTAVLRQDHYEINGAKAFISGGGMSDIYVCMVRTGDASHKGITCLLIEKDTPGLSFGAQERKLGWKNQPTRMIFFEQCKVPITHRIGAEGEGFKIALQALNGGRINIAACSLGGAAECLKLSQKYLKERKQFGVPLEAHQALRFYFADMITEYEAAKLMVYQAAEALEKHHPDAPLKCAMAKRFATDMAFSVSNQALQLHGGYGYLQDYTIERFFRDLRVHQILEGTNEIMKEIIAKITLNEHYSL